MHPKRRHITQQLEAYLDNQLSPTERRRVEEHAADCPDCARQLFDARRISTELGSVLKTRLGQPAPPAALRQRVRQAFAAQASRRFTIPWAVPGRILNAVGTMVVVGLLAWGVVMVIRGQTGVNVTPSLQSARPGESGGEATATITPLPTILLVQAITPTPVPSNSRLKDTIPQPKPRSFDSLSLPADQVVEKNVFQQQIIKNISTPVAQSLILPEGTIAFSLFNAAPDRQVYETHLINPDGSNRRVFPLDGISEPALSPDGQYLAYRAWSQPTSPRSLLSSNLEGYTPQRVGGFWEDALPDWSPTESRIIFSSQRETDRRWRLYTSWGDGSNEVNLRREGRNPTFAPDGYRFAFESCGSIGYGCGLWLGDLENSEYGSRPFLEDSLAQAPDWSPVGESIAYMANPDGNWDLYLVESDGSNVRRLTTTPAVDGLPVWSPDGKWLAFLSNRSGEWGVWLLHVDTGEIKQAISLSDASFIPPAGSPYGQRNWWDEQLSWGQ